jgi:hypothetical protein
VWACDWKGCGVAAMRWSVSTRPRRPHSKPACNWDLRARCHRGDFFHSTELSQRMAGGVQIVPPLDDGAGRVEGIGHGFQRGHGRRLFATQGAHVRQAAEGHEPGQPVIELRVQRGCALGRRTVFQRCTAVPHCAARSNAPAQQCAKPSARVSCRHSTHRAQRWAMWKWHG